MTLEEQTSAILDAVRTNIRTMETRPLGHGRGKQIIQLGNSEAGAVLSSVIPAIRSFRRFAQA
jgi:hypothetical protein